MSEPNSYNIRNFVILAHIDHGKSTLADRLLELTRTVEDRKMTEQFLDAMDLERERGITIKMQPVTMRYNASYDDNNNDSGNDDNNKYDNNQNQNSEFILNMIDTPGHVDFSYEVSRSLAAAEGAILLVDATSGIQAQTVANLSIAVKQNLKIIPVINKIDLPQAQVQEAEEEILNLLISMNVEPDEIYKVSAKTGEGVKNLLSSIVALVPPPPREPEKHLRALIFDSIYDDYKGVISYVRILDGEIKAGEKVLFMQSGVSSEAKEVGVFSPHLTPRDKLRAGDVGYIIGGIKDIKSASIGDTITKTGAKAETPVPGYRSPQPLVFSTLYPREESDYDGLRDAMEKLRLNDAALYFEPEYSPVLGRGLKAGFLGMLHMDIIVERLRREYSIGLVITAPSVAYRVYKKIPSSGSETQRQDDGEQSKEVIDVYSPAQFPNPPEIEYTEEPWVNLEVIVSPEYMSGAMSLLKTLRGHYVDTEYIGAGSVKIIYKTPLVEIISDFYDNLKNATSGFGSMAYEMAGYAEAEIIKLDILLAGEQIPSLSRLVHKDRAEEEGRRIVKKIKEVLPPEQFAVPIQAAIGGKVIARETKPALKKKVTEGLYGGDFSRKKKQLQKQKKGKKKMEEQGRIKLDTNTMIKIFQ